MMYRHLLGAALLLLLTLPAAAQKASMWKHLQRPDAGASIRFLSLAASDSTASNDIENRINLVSLAAIGGFNLPFAELDDDMSIGFNPNIVAGTSLSQLSALSIEIPAYITFKWGTDATWAGSKGGVGMTIGAGYDYNIFVPVQWGFGAITYGIPSVMAELNFGKRRGGLGLIKLRYSMGIGNHTETYMVDGDPLDLVMTQYAIDLIITSAY
jgi:hypothetical protein